MSNSMNAQDTWREITSWAGPNGVMAWPSDMEDDHFGSFYSWYSVDSASSLEATMADPEKCVWVAIPHCGWGEYTGDAVDGANIRAIYDVEHADAAELGWIARVGGSHGHEALFVRADILLDTFKYEDEDDAARAQSLRDTIQHLHDYPIVDEDVLSEVEQELQDEAMSGYILADVQHRLRERVAEEIAASTCSEPGAESHCAHGCAHEHGADGSCKRAEGSCHRDGTCTCIVTVCSQEPYNDAIDNIDDDALRALIYQVWQDGAVDPQWEYHGRSADLIDLDQTADALPLDDVLRAAQEGE